jgi:hypothetical protein
MSKRTKSDDPWSKLSRPQQSALWQIQQDGGLIMTMHSPDKSPYSTKTGRIIDLRVAKALIDSGELIADGGGFDFGPPQAWAVTHPKVTI